MVKYLRDDDAKRADALASEAGVSTAELFGVLVWSFGEQGRDLARENRIAAEAMARRLRGQVEEDATVADGKGCGFLGCGSQNRVPCRGCGRIGMRGEGKRFVPGSRQEGAAA